MDAQKFLAEFRPIANAPGGIDRLRNLILRLAVAGDLVSVDSPTGDPQLLERILLQKRDHDEKKKVIPKQASVQRGMVAAPSHWNVCRLGDIALTITGGGTPSKSHPEYWDGDIPWASVKDLKDFQYLERTEDHITEEGLRNSSTNLIPPGRVIVCTRMGLGKAAINRIPMAINQDLKALELPQEINPDFFLLVYKTREVRGAGMTVAGIKQDELLAIPIAIPPKEEQSRIVAKVDELMALCDQLEQQQQDRRKLQNALRQSTLQALASAQSPHDIRASWQRLQANFGQFFSKPSDVAELRSLLVELAIRGALTPEGVQEPSGNSAGQVGDQAVQRSSRRFVKGTTIDSPFDLPPTWNWVLFEELLEGSESGWSPKCDAEPRHPGEWGVLKVSAVTWGEFRAEENKRLPLSLDPRPECEVKAGDFLLSRANTAELVARSVIAPPSVPGRLLMSDKIVRLRFLDEELKPWANLVNNSLFAREHYRSSATGTSDSMRNVSRQVIYELPIPLPPKHVQRAVMRRLEELNELCARLEEGLKDKAQLSARLSEAAMAALTGINIELDKDTAVKAPQTELIAPLRLATPPGVKAQAPLATILVRHEGEMAARDLWQRFGGEIDAFYAQLKIEVAHGWIAEPEPAQVREKPNAETMRA